MRKAKIDSAFAKARWLSDQVDIAIGRFDRSRGLADATDLLVNAHSLYRSAQKLHYRVKKLEEESSQGGTQ